MNVINFWDARQKIYSTKGKIFTAIFTKKSGEERKINCRLGVHKDLSGKGLNYDPDSKGLINVYDLKAQGYRMINIKTLKALAIDKQTYVVSEVA